MPSKPRKGNRVLLRTTGRKGVELWLKEFMRYLIPTDRTKKAHLATETDPVDLLCRNTSIPLHKYTLWRGELKDEGVCANCLAVSFADNPENMKIERVAVFQCECCGHPNVGVGGLEFGFYCQQCG